MPQFHSEFTESLSLQLGTPTSTADAIAIASLLRGIVVLLKETERELAAESRISIRVRPFVEGSFEIPVDLVLVGGAVLIEFSPYIAQVLECVKQYVELRKLLRGNSLDDESTATEQGVSNVVIRGNNNVVNVIQNLVVTSAINEAIVEIEKDPNVTDVRLVNETTGQRYVSIPRSEFSYFRSATSATNESIAGHRVRRVQATLTIRSPVLVGTAKWKFTYEGLTLSAEMRDPEFNQRVATRIERFAAGDRLEVDLEIEERFNSAISDYDRTGKYSCDEGSSSLSTAPRRYAVGTISR